ncbi:PREDICTED: uncharacterized protein LOC109478152 isoform X1 [Branchiostoma belcheri]|uniref:Uncharacterized protein LOC109478152 isoform X1 n=1 Tax=Branchiostoma belcheri TaxID=7741 RepID=A0A6P4ZEP4_BRABE|nr:PREDICTED: uncharacterized protein LOC109478152 isoform X1 [Branchiostoma belcheri]
MMESDSWEDKLTCTWKGEGQLDIMGFPEDMPMCLKCYLSSIKAGKWPRALYLIQEGEGHCFLSGTGISFPRDYESSSSDEDGPGRGPLPEDEVEFFSGRFPKNRLKRLLFLRTVKKCLSKRRETHGPGPVDGEQQFLHYLEEEEEKEKRSELDTELTEPGSTSPKESLSSESSMKGKTVEVPQRELEETTEKTVRAEKTHHEKLRKHHRRLKGTIRAHHITGCLKEKGVLTDDDVDKIYDKAAQEERTEQLLFILAKRSSSAIEAFIQSLKEVQRQGTCPYEDIVQLLEGADPKQDAAVEERIDDKSRFVPKLEKGPGQASHVDIQDLITNNYDLLKENINAMKVIPHMIHKRVLERSDQDKIFRQSILDSDYAESEALLDMLSRRRSCHPALFLDILRIEHPDIVERLSTEVSSPKAIISRQKDDAGPFYRMTHKSRGTALIFIDADLDTSAMKEESELLADAFKSLHFATKIVRDFDLSSAIQPGGRVDQDCHVFCCISDIPHGMIHDIVRYQSRNDKPMLIFCHIPARLRPNPMSMYMFFEVVDHDSQDCYLSLSSSPNYIRTLAKTLIEYGKSEDFVSMMSKVYSACDKFYCHDGLRKRLYFPP